MRARLISLAAAMVSVGGLLTGPASASTVHCAIENEIYSGGVNGDTGVLYTCYLSTGVDLLHVTYDYCYLANTNGVPATVATVGYLAGAAPVVLDTFSFQHPHNSFRTTCTTWSMQSFSALHLDFTRIEFQYINGDWRLGIRDILITGT